MAKIMSASKLKALDQFAAGFHGDFRFSSVKINVLPALGLAGVIGHLYVYSFDLPVGVTMVSAALIPAMFIRIAQVWEAGPDKDASS